ncbi:MAG: lactonase family protein [Nitrococcus sp.]|nr:lactonase family protein [Nitrococcus sp.]
MQEQNVRAASARHWRPWRHIATAAMALAIAGCGAGADDGPATLDSLLDGAVFAMSNAVSNNEVVAYTRGEDGTLTQVGVFPTNGSGSGSGSFEDSANGLVLATRDGEIAPNNLVEPESGNQFLFVTSAGSNNITVFEVADRSLNLVDLQPSGGEKPVSITVNDGLVYVLNSGEFTDSLFDAEGNIIVNCTTGELPTVTGFTVDSAGELTPIPNSERQLSGVPISGCAQISFSPNGNTLVVTERLAQPDSLNQQTNDNERLDDEGVIVTFQVEDDGTLRNKRLIDATGQGPFGFTFALNGNLITTEQFDGPNGPGRGAATSYVPKPGVPGALLRASPSAPSGGTDTCWIVLTDDQTVGYATSFFQDGRISSYLFDEIGLVRIISKVVTGSPDAQNDPVAMGASDLALSRDSEFLYQLNSINGTINTFRVTDDGGLEFIEQHTPFPQPPFGPGGGEGAPIGLAAS